MSTTDLYLTNESIRWSGYPHQPLPHAVPDRFGIVERCSALHVQSLDHALGSDVVRGGVGEHFRQIRPLKCIPQRGLRGLGGVAATPGRTYEAPADVEMLSERMTGTRRHDSGIAQKLLVEVFDEPAAEADLCEGPHVAPQFGVAVGAVQRAAQIS